MKWLTFNIQKEPGFRLNLVDMGLILLLCAASYVARPIYEESYYYLLPLYIGFSFFLFCNVFRIGNRLEAFWYISFLLVLVYSHDSPQQFWWLVLLILEPLKLFLILYRLRQVDYRGIFYGYRRHKRSLHGR